MSEEKRLKTKLRISKYGFWTALITMAITILDKFSGFVTGQQQIPPEPVEIEPLTEEPVEEIIIVESYAPEGLVMPWHWVIVIVCLLLALASILLYKKIKRRHRKIAQDRLPR